MTTVKRKQVTTIRGKRTLTVPFDIRFFHGAVNADDCPTKIQTGTEIMHFSMQRAHCTALNQILACTRAIVTRLSLREELFLIYSSTSGCSEL